MELGKECRQAGLAQLEERGSHNPEVVSSSLTTRIIFASFSEENFYYHYQYSYILTSWSPQEIWELSF